MFIKNKIIILLVCFIGLFNTTKSDEISKFFDLKKLGSLYPDNSFSMVQNDELNISKINGSVLFSLPISQYSTNGYPLSVTLNYSGGISTTSYAFCYIDQGHWAKMHQTRPAWIIGVNGIAVQVFAGNAMFTCDPLYQLENWRVATGQNDFTITDKDVTWMIDGYDVCNELYPLGRAQSQDVIKILKSDGSLLEFRNQFTTTNTTWFDKNKYTGKYYLNEVNSTAYAIVDFDWSQKNLYDEFLLHDRLVIDYIDSSVSPPVRHWKPDTVNFGGIHYFHNLLDSLERLYYQPRELKYYPGDGYVYIFKEYKMPYGEKSFGFRDESGLLNNYNSGNAKSFGLSISEGNTNLKYGPLSHPNIFYLYEIRSAVKEITRFEYAKHITPEYLSTGLSYDATLGRAALKAFNNHEISYELDYAQIKAFDKVFDISIDSAVKNGYYARNTSESRSDKLLMKSNMNFDYALDLSNDPLSSSRLYYSTLGYVTKIESDGIQYKFSYEDYYKIYENCKYPITDSGYHKIKLMNKRLKSYESYNKKIVLNYIPGNFNEQIPFNLNGMSNQDSVYKTSTSQYLNNYIHTVNDYSKSQGSIQLEKTENYSYGISPTELVSVITTYDANTGKSFTTTSKFNKYQLEPILGYVNTNNPPPFVYHSNLAYSKIDDYSDIFENSKYYTKIKAYQIVDSLDISRTKAKSDSLVIKNKIVHQYNFGTVSPDKIVFENTELNDLTGFLLKSDTVKVFHANDTLQSITVNNYQNFLQDSLLGIVIEKTYQKHASLQKWDSLKALNDERVIGKEFWDIQCIVGVFKIDTITYTKLFTNDLFGISQSSKQYNRFGEMINGKSNNLMNNIIIDEKPLFAIGKVRSDTIFGNYGVSKPGNFYDYSPSLTSGTIDFRSSNSTGMLTKVKNNLGVHTKMFYNYEEYMNEEQSFFDDCIYEFYGGYKLFNDNNNNFKSILLEGEFDLNSVPIINSSEVRKFNLDENRNLYLDTIKLTEYKAKNRLGNITQSVDLNGWLSEFKYDKHGRMKLAWLPGDFPDTESLLDLSDSLESSGVSISTGKKEYLRVGCSKFGEEMDYFRYVSPDYASNYVDIGKVCNFHNEDIPAYYCECGPIPQGLINPPNGDDLVVTDDVKDNNKDKFDYPDLQYIDITPDSCYTYKDFLYIDSCTIDIDFLKPGIAHSIISLDSVLIKLYIKSLLYYSDDIDNLVLNITSNLGDCIHYNYLLHPSNIIGMVNEHSYYLTITLYNNDCLTALKDKLNNLNDNKLTLHAEVVTENQGIEFDNITMKSYGTFLLPQREDTDYTLKADYLDNQNFVFKNQKVDDNLHSSNDYPLQYMNFGLRRLESFLFFKNNKVYASKRGFDSSANVFYYDIFGKVINQYDPLNFMDSLEYDLAGNVSKFINKDNTFKVNKAEYGKPLQDFGITEHSFNDFCKKVRSTDEIGNAVDMYYDGFDKLIIKIEDPDTLRIATKYEYDKFDRLKYVIDAKFDTTKYWYDNYGNIKYKYHPDLGYTSYSYDDFGNLRFSQDQNQADSAKISFFEYDDLNRLMVSGEAKLLAPWQTAEPISNEIHENYVFGRFTDIIEPNELQNGLTDILTLNSTLWSETLLDTTYCDRKLELDSIHPLSVYPINYWKVNHILDDSTVVPLPMIYHVSNMTGDQLTYDDESWKEGFENFNSRPKNVLNAYFYDDFPPNIGPAWRDIKDKNIWDALSPKGMLRNTKGKISAMAYRESGKQEFNYMVFSYDERGRIEALLRFTENLGFDGIYYQYNSANLVIKTTVIDPVRQFNTWYGYDGAGRVDTVWSKIEDGGFHFDNSTWSNAPSKPAFHNKSLSRDFNYSYTKRDQIDSIFYPNQLSENFTYQARGWQQKHDLLNGSNLYLNSSIFYINNGLISGIMENSNSPFIQQKSNVYAYDNRNQLLHWNLQTVGNPPTPVMSENYTYDSLGNRTYKTKLVNNGHTDYFYNDPNGPNRLTEYYSKMNIFQFEKRVFQQFHSDGALYLKCIYTPQSIPGTLCAYEVKKEEFFYNYLNLTNKYIFQTGEACSVNTIYNYDYPKTEWRYRFNPFGEREQKRMYQSPLGDTGDEFYPWVYYLLGIDNRQYATYYGMQSNSDNIALSDYTNMGKIEPERPTTFYYPVEYNVYGNEQAPKMTYKYVNGQWQKQYKIYDYLGSLRYTMSGTGQVLNYKTYEPYGGTMLDTLGVTRQSYIGKEKDVESSLGDHGVRKYDYETGRFNSVDPLFEKYMGWSPYQYSMNNPIWAKDWNGRDIIVLLDKEGASGAGHAAMLIGNDETGWQLISKNGTSGLFGALGPSKNPQLGDNPDTDEKENFYPTLNAFISDKKDENDNKILRYEVGYRITSNEDKDKEMVEAGKKAAGSWYSLIGSNCMDAVNKALKAVGFNVGSKAKKAGRYGEQETQNNGSQLIPNDQYNQIKENNSGTEINIQKERNK